MMANERLRQLGALFAIATCSMVHAQTPDEEDLALVYGDKYTVSIATGAQQPIRRAPAVASVITAEDIKAMGAIDLDDVLASVPGMHVNRSANFYAPLYVVRGVMSQYNPQVLMLQNGIPMTTLFVGNKGNLWGGLPLENVARIEIIRGPGSALYGADAFSGVINIITKTADEIEGTQLGGRAGSFNTWDTWALHGGKLGTVDVAAYLRVGRTDGFRQLIESDAATAGGSSLAPGFTNNQQNAIDGSVDFSLGKWRWRSAYKLRDDMGTGAGVSQALDPVGRGKSERLTSDLSWANPNIALNWGANFVASYMQYKQRFPVAAQLLPPGTALDSGTFLDGMIGAPETSERQFRLSAAATYTGFKAHNIRLGLGYDYLDLYNTREIKNFTFTAAGSPVPAGALQDYSTIAPFLTPHQRRVTYFYVQDEWRVASDWTLTTGVRHDHYSDFGNTTNPRVALVWDASLDLTAKLLYGRAFRAPAFNEQYSINNPVARGNSTLRPETNSTVEAAFSWQAREDTQINVNFFRYEMKDIIRTVPNAAAGTGSTWNNTGEQHGTGMELEAVWDYSHATRFSGNYSYQRSVDDPTNEDAGYAPRHRVYLRADWRYSGNWVATTQINQVMDRKRVTGDDRPPIPDYTTVDLTLRSSRGKGKWDFAVLLRNIFDADVREPTLSPGLIPNDLPMAPRSIYLQASYKM
jgi:outer membrane receptor protein involved in Fe transport